MTMLMITAAAAIVAAGLLARAWTAAHPAPLLLMILLCILALVLLAAVAIDRAERRGETATARGITAAITNGSAQKGRRR